MDILPETKQPPGICKPCIEGIHACTPIPKETLTRADTVLGCVFSDIWGPATVATPSKEQYYILFIDDKSHRISVSLIKNKSNTFTEYKSFVACAEKETGVLIKALWTDGGGEYGLK